MNLQTWLQNLGLEQYSQAFTDNEVDFAILPKLTAEDLKEIGVSAVGHRRKLLEAIASLAPEQAPNPTSVNTTVSAERRNLTVMFVDLVGSTQLSTRLDPEDMRSIILTYQKQVAEEIARVGGNVAKFMGDGVLAYFGWPQAHENEAERAVRAGLAISKSISQQKDPTGATLAARVGIATGLVVVGDLIGSGSAQEETVVGDTPNLAARLQSFAEPAQVVISDSTFRQLHGMFDVSNLGGLQLKGIAQRQTAYAVLAERPLESRFAARATSGGYTPLIGREAELGLLASKWLLAKDDQVALALVTGEAGIGKSRLVEALIEQAKTQPFKLIRVQCAPHHSASALHPFINQIQISAQLQPTDTLAERNLKLDRILAPYEKEDRFLLLSVLGEKPEQLENMASLSPQQLRYRTLQALLLHFTHKSEAQPILLVFEDAHWADPSSVEFLAMLLETSGGGIFLLLTARPEFKSVIAAHPAASTIVLNRLARNHTAEIAKLSTTTP